jgi:glycosyltransferase involved in cell wall biosynthesis
VGLYALNISICMPVYNGGDVVKDTIDSILKQSFSDFELIITDDHSTDDTVKKIEKIKDDRIKLYRYEKNVGYPGNLERCRTKCSNDILFLMGQDDILAQDTLERVHSIFMQNDNIGAITRPYYWFHKDIEKPVRAKEQFSDKRDSVISINDDFKSIIKVFQSLDQLSGLAFRRKYVDCAIHKDIFTAHIYAFASIFKRYDVVYLKDYVIAVRISTSQTRQVSSVYSKSPMQSWIDMFNTVFSEEKFQVMREFCIKNFVAKNFVGLVQIKNYGKRRWLIREIMLLIKYNQLNLVDPQFWFFSIGTLAFPKSVLAPLVDFYKEHILSKTLTGIQPIKTQKFGGDNH